MSAQPSQTVNKIIFFRRSAERDAVVQRIRSFADLPAGWCYGRGRAIDRAVRNDALTVNSELRRNRVGRVEVFPGADGTVLVSAVDGPYSIEVRCYGSGLFGVTIDESDQSIIDLDRVRSKDLESIISEFAWPSKKSSGSFTLNTIVMSNSGLQVRHFESPTTEHPSWSQYVLLNKVGLSVRTPAHFTRPILPAIRRYS